MALKVKHVVKYCCENKLELLILTSILLIALFLRTYKIREFIIFLGDEGRDALVVRRMIVDYKFTLLGPTASVGGFYLGPIYYYFMIPFLWLANFDPVGPAVMVALLGTITVALVYWTSREWFDVRTAMITSMVYATAPGIILSSRSSWNPNIMPFFALLAVVSLYKAATKNKLMWTFISGASIGVAIQSHYLGLILGPIIAVSALVSFEKRHWVKNTLTGIVGFFTGGSMYFAFEFRHNFPNIRSVLEFIGRGGNTTGPRSINIVWLFIDMVKRMYEAAFITLDLSIRNWLVYLSITGLLLVLINRWKKKRKLSLGFKLLLVWLVVGIFGIGSYKGQLYPHYFGFLLPVPVLILGVLLGQLVKKNSTKYVAYLLVGLLLYLNLSTLPIWGRGSNLIDQTERVAEAIGEITDDEPFNFALISSGNSDHAYRYFLEINGKKPRTLEEEVTQQLIVICEEIDNPCLPLGHPLWEVAGFGRAEVVLEKSVDPGIKIVKMVHHEDSKHLIGSPAPKGG